VGEGSHGKVKSFWQIVKLWSWGLHLGEEHNIKTLQNRSSAWIFKLILKFASLWKILHS
jgi:hypothetical protein